MPAAAVQLFNDKSCYKESDKETRRWGDKEKGRQGESPHFPLSPFPLVCQYRDESLFFKAMLHAPCPVLCALCPML